MKQLGGNGMGCQGRLCLHALEREKLGDLGPKTGFRMPLNFIISEDGPKTGFRMPLIFHPGTPLYAYSSLFESLFTRKACS